MRRTMTIAGAALVLLAAAPGRGKPRDLAARAGKAPAPVAKAGGHDEERAILAALSKYSEPGEQHRWLQALCGSWTTLTRTWMGAGPPSEAQGTSEVRAILGGRFIEEQHQSRFLGRPFEGRGLTGYDLGKQRFVNSWIDSMGTWMTSGEGTLDPTGKVLTVSATNFDPMSGKTATSRWVTRIEGPDRHVFEVYDQVGDKEAKVMEVIYTRKEAPR